MRMDIQALPARIAVPMLAEYRFAALSPAHRRVHIFQRGWIGLCGLLAADEPEEADDVVDRDRLCMRCLRRAQQMGWKPQEVKHGTDH